MNKKPQSKRELVRVPYEQNVLINGALRVQAIDLSEGGLYLHTGRSFPSNSVVEVSFPLFHETLSVQAVVRFSHEGVGMGLMFKALNDQQKALVRRYITETLKEGTCQEDSRRKLLFIGDNEMTMKMYRSEFTLAQISMFQANNETQAMEIIRDQDIGLILIAMDMEKRENFNLLSLIKMSPLAQKIPVIVVSPANLPGTKKKVYDIGAELFMEKITASPKKVVEAVQKLFEEACS